MTQRFATFPEFSEGLALTRHIYAIGRNYADHAAEFQQAVPSDPLVFLKPVSALISAEAPIRLPLWAGRVDYEGELAVVIGQKARSLTLDEAESIIAGYTIMNDVTARDLQRADGQWSRAKGFDTFAPCGPHLVRELDWRELDLVTTVNGTVRQHGNTRDMIFNIPFLIAHISRFATLWPGDVITTGTPAGVGPLQPGDCVEISITGIGTLRNPVVEDTR